MLNMMFNDVKTVASKYVVFFSPAVWYADICQNRSNDKPEHLLEIMTTVSSKTGKRRKKRRRKLRQKSV